MLEPLPPSAFVADDSPGRANAESHLTAAWRFAAGPDHPVGSAIWFAVAVVLALLVTWPLRLGDLTSDPCPRCGLAREPDDPGKTGGNPHCLPCYRTHIGGADLDYNLRNHYEEILGRNESAQTLLRRLLSVLPPGGGHALAGRVLGAILVPFLFGAGLFLGLDPGWSWTPPDMLMGRDWFGYRVLGWFFAGTAGLRALFAAKDDVRPHSDSGAGGNRG